jgi:UDP-2,4-diacetamido-2,4,6-trideoxy-beta-L-altropyranose hydrolase
MHIAIRADASTRIGYGHIMRCLTLADAFVTNFNSSISINFICHRLPNKLSEKIKANGFSVINIDSDVEQDEWSQSHDAQQCIQVLSALNKNNNIDLLIQDHYQLNLPWQQALHPYTSFLLVIDDLADRPHQADFLLDQTFERKAKDYQGLVNESCQLFVGESYILLRDEFTQLISQAKQNRENSKAINNIMVSLGGMDPDNVTAKVLNSLIQWQSYHQAQNQHNRLSVNVVMGSSAPYLESIKALCQQHSWLNLHQDCNNMAELMLAADLAIGASGSSAWERCSLGLPTLSIEIADNQALVSKNLANFGAIVNLSTAEHCKEQDIIDALKSSMTDNKKYQQMVEQCFKCCDGQGAQRLFSKISSTINSALTPATNSQEMNSNITLRAAIIDDLDLVFAWQSQSEIRRFSRNPKPVKYQEHCTWFTSALVNKKKNIFIIIENDEPLGMLRLDKIESAGFELSILVDPKIQGGNIATSAISAIPIIFRNISIYAFVHPDNKASHRLFKKANFKQISHEQYVLLPETILTKQLDLQDK